MPGVLLEVPDSPKCQPSPESRYLAQSSWNFTEIPIPGVAEFFEWALEDYPDISLELYPKILEFPDILLREVASEVLEILQRVPGATGLIGHSPTILPGNSGVLRESRSFDRSRKLFPRVAEVLSWSSIRKSGSYRSFTRNHQIFFSKLPD